MSGGHFVNNPNSNTPTSDNSSKMSADGYTEEERAAAWAAYYAQQGYDEATIAQMMGGTYGAAASSSTAGASTGTVPGYDKDGYKIKTTIPESAQNAPLLDADLLKTTYMKPVKHEDPKKHGGSSSSSNNPNKIKYTTPGQRETVVRKGSGRVWEDPTLLEWDPKWYRLFVGDVSNDVSERTLDEAFNKYPSYCKCKVVRDRLSQKAKYGFIAFKDPEDFLRAWKEMDGKYVGNRPIRLTKIKEDKYGQTSKQTLSARKAKELDKLARNKGKPLNGRPTPW